MIGRIYFDWNATTPPHPDVIDAMRGAHERAWANPSSVHGPGRDARARLEEAREAVAALIGLDARDVTLTSGGTEANNLALLASRGGDGATGLVVSRLEHPSIARAAEELARRGVPVAWIEADEGGRIEAAAVEAAMDRLETGGAKARLVAVQAANHETGVLHDIDGIAAVTRSRGALLAVDAVQAVGKVERAAWGGADVVTVAAHKIRGPKAIGAIATRPGVKLAPLLSGGSQEKGLRPGTQDAAACAGFAVAAARARDGHLRYAELARLRDDLESRLVLLARSRGVELIRNGGEPRLPHVTNSSWTSWQGDELCAALDLEGVAVSSGAACSAGTAEPSAVIRAMAGEARAASAVRISIGETTTAAEIDEALRRFEMVLARS